MNSVKSMFDALNETYTTVVPNFRVQQMNSISSWVYAVANIMIGVALSVSFMMIAFSFISFATAMGDKDRMKQARYALTLSVIAFLVAILSVAMKTIILKLLGASANDAALNNI